MSSADPEQQETTARDGAPVVMRRIVPADAPLLEAAYERLGEQSRRRRFVVAPAHLAPEDLRYLTNVDGRRHDALVALDEATGDLVGEARYVREPGRQDTAEVAVFVVDDRQGQGIGTALLMELTRRARVQGIRRYKALVAADNRAVLDALASRVEGEATAAEDGQIQLEFDFPAEGLSERLTAALGWAARGQLRLLGAVARRVKQASPV